MKARFIFIRDLSIVIIAASIIIFIFYCAVNKLFNHSNEFGRLKAKEEKYERLKSEYDKIIIEKEYWHKLGMYIRVYHKNIYNEAIKIIKE